MNELKGIFANKKTENGDDSYNTTGDKLLDILFMSQYYRNHLNEIPDISREPRAYEFAMFIRDPRFGIGERDLGRDLLYQVTATSEDIVKCGRFDDLLYVHPYDLEHIEFLVHEAKAGNELAKKWLPRFNSKKYHYAKTITDYFGMNKKQYYALCRVETVESKMSRKAWDEINYAHVPSKAMMKYWDAFDRNDHDRFQSYLEDLKQGKTKINTSVSTPYDVYKNFIGTCWYGSEVKSGADEVFKALPQVNLGSIVPIIDNSGSMYDDADSQGKAKAIGHYVAKNNTYLPNHIVSFSAQPKLIELGNTYEKDVKLMNSYHDVSNTDFGKVMDMFSKLENDFPDYLLVLSDMEFDYGSNQSKEECMELFKRNGANTKIIWWNFNTRNTTSPELDSYGNIFMSGYSPQLLKFLESGFDGKRFLNKLLDEYVKVIDK